MAEVKDSKAVLPTVTTATIAEASTGKKIVAQFGALMRKNFLVQKLGLLKSFLFGLIKKNLPSD